MSQSTARRIVGFIGLGTMGLEMARNLMKAGITALVANQYLEATAHGEGRNGNQALFRVYDRMTARSMMPSSR